MPQVNGKWQFADPWDSETRELVWLKFGRIDDIVDWGGDPNPKLVNVA